METIIILSLIVSSLIFSIYFVLNKRSKALNFPPGPPKLPIIGNIHQLGGDLQHRVFRNLAKKYGPIMHVQIGQVSTVVVSSPSLAKEVFKTNDLALADRPKTLLSEIIMYGNSDIMLSPYSESWKQLKKIVSVEVLSPKKVRSFSGYREQELALFLEFLRASSGKPVTIRPKAMEMMNNLICKSSFGDKCKQQHLLLEMMDEMAKLGGEFHVAYLFPDYEFLPVISGLTSKYKKVSKGVDKVFDAIFEDRKIARMNGETQQENLLDVLLGIKETGRLQFPITMNNIKAVLVNMFNGGTDTSAITIDWAMAELARNPNVMKKTQKELRETFKGKKTIDESDLKDLSYLKFVIKETLRLHPAVPLLLPRECRKECNIGGYTIPVKTQVIVNAWACALDPEYWDDPKSFKPERFEESSVDFLGSNFEFVPFGVGRRMCPGITFSLVAIELALAQMLYHFDWQLPLGLNPEDIDMKEQEGTIASIKKVPLELIPVPYSVM